MTPVLLFAIISLLFPLCDGLLCLHCNVPKSKSDQRCDQTTECPNKCCGYEYLSNNEPSIRRTCENDPESIRGNETLSYCCETEKCIAEEVPTSGETPVRVPPLLIPLVAAVCMARMIIK